MLLAGSLNCVLLDFLNEPHLICSVSKRKPGAEVSHSLDTEQMRSGSFKKSNNTQVKLISQKDESLRYESKYHDVDRKAEHDNRGSKPLIDVIVNQALSDRDKAEPGELHTVYNQIHNRK